MKNKKTNLYFLLVAIIPLILFLLFKTSSKTELTDSKIEYVSINNIGEESCLQCHKNTKGISVSQGVCQNTDR